MTLWQSLQDAVNLGNLSLSEKNIVSGIVVILFHSWYLREEIAFSIP
jgi:hypothetical protein